MSEIKSAQPTRPPSGNGALIHMRSAVEARSFNECDAAPGAHGLIRYRVHQLGAALITVTLYTRGAGLGRPPQPTPCAPLAGGAGRRG
jgi:hypothetical protein